MMTTDTWRVIQQNKGLKPAIESFEPSPVLGHVGADPAEQGLKQEIQQRAQVMLWRTKRVIQQNKD